MTVYDYDAQGRLYHTYQYDTADGYIDINSVRKYDSQNRLTKVIDKISYPVSQSSAASVISQSYGYTKGLLTSFSIDLASDSSYGITYTYDHLQRLTGATNTAPGDWSISTTYTYLDRQDVVGYTTEYIGTVNTVTPSSDTTYSYTYDSKGNITKIVITEGTSVKEIRYVYDDVGQLIREDNEPLDVTYVYNYDDAGNLLDVYYYDLTAADSTPANLYFSDAYMYSDEILPDALYFFNGDWLEYDTIGNPTKYFNYTGDYSLFYFTWTGRELTSATRGTDSYTFAYNENGLRSSKVKNGVETKYYYDGDLLLMEARGDVTLYYLYDESGSPIGMRYRQNNAAADVWQNFWYEKNIFGDIVAIYNDSGTKLVSYVYDAWGRTEVTYHNGGASTGAALNPFTYRGYYYDADLGFYYLQSRYYDPAIRRFISPDHTSYLGANGDLLSYNLYAYCSNNPVMYTDPTGHFPWLVFAALMLFTPVGGTALQVAASVLGYAGFAVASVFDEDIRKDMDRIGWNPFNSDETAVLESQKVSFYKGVPVIRTEMGRSGSFGAIFINSLASSDTLRHEYGHNVQQMLMGPVKYGLMMFVPSWQQWSEKPYYERPWEITADIFGGVTSRRHEQRDINRGYLYLATSSIFGPFGYFFLFGEY